MTYSILARNPATGELGRGGTERLVLLAGAERVEAGLGAVASQAIGEAAFGHLSVEMIRIGSTSAQVMTALTAADATPSIRQIGAIVLTSTPSAVPTASPTPSTR